MVGVPCATMTTRPIVLACLALIALAIVGAASPSSAPSLVPGRHGSTLTVLTREDLTQGFMIHESATLSTIWPAQPCYNNLVSFDPGKPLESLDTVVPDLAEK